ncbi:hypothetical protein OEZ86_014189 [Tetradesmus obliquus]|nr:hypothetical protein OEZ86_014189 [Tetradesmus obliquus]
MLHDSLLPFGEAGARIAGGRRHAGRRGGVVRGRADSWLPNSRRAGVKPARVAAGVAGLAAISNAVKENILPGPEAAQQQQQQQQQQPPFGSSSSSISRVAPQSRCSAVAEALLTAMDSMFPAPPIGNNNGKNTTTTTTSSSSSSSSSSEAALFTAQRGFVDWGTAGGPAQGSDPSCQLSCSFTNPTAAYGLTVLPLSPNEDLKQKVEHEETPKHAKQNLDGRYGAGMAPSWQLLRDEVVVLAGCLPPLEASR